MKVIRDYLTSDELSFIIKSMLEKSSAIEREVVKVGLVAQLVCEDIGDYENCNDVYDKVVADSKLNFAEIVNNYNIIDKLVAEETSFEKILKDFLDNIGDKVEKSIKDIDFKNVLTQFKEIVEKGDVVDDGKHKVQQSPRNKKISK